MEKLKDEISLVNKIESISMMELRSAPGEILMAVDFGKTFIITKGKKSIAVLSKLPGINLTINVDNKGKTTYKL